MPIYIYRGGSPNPQPENPFLRLLISVGVFAAVIGARGFAVASNRSNCFDHFRSDRIFSRCWLDLPLDLWKSLGSNLSTAKWNESQSDISPRH